MIKSLTATPICQKRYV